LKVIVDRDIFITHLRSQTQIASLEQFERRSIWYMSSVVAMELRIGCRTQADVRLLSNLLDPFERTQRVVYPDHRMWVRAGTILADLRSVDRSRRQGLVNDTLIALSAISIGACIVSANRRDFATLSRVLPVKCFGSVNEALTFING
jgi:predicted nucleic acid-binding protein